jgi:Flp pilus assembly protein TadG
MAAILAIVRRWRSDSGAELIEFALAFPLLLLVVLGIVDFGFLFQQYEVMTNAAREGARIAALPDYQANLDANVSDRVIQYLNGAGLTDPARTVAVASSTLVVGGVCTPAYAVTVTYPHSFSFVGGIARYFGATFGSSTLTATSTMRAEAAVGCGP